MYIVSIKNKNGQDEQKPFVTDNLEVITNCITSAAGKDVVVIVDTIDVR